MCIYILLYINISLHKYKYYYYIYIYYYIYSLVDLVPKSSSKTNRALRHGQPNSSLRVAPAKMRQWLKVLAILHPKWPSNSTTYISTVIYKYV